MSSKRARRLAAGLFPLQVEMLENRLLLSAAATTTALIASNNPIVAGQVIALTATVASPGGSPDGGTITFMDGATLIGTVAVDTSTEQAVAFTNSLGLGTHSLTAVYDGTADFLGSTSSALTETVNPPAIATTTTLVASQSSISDGQVVALTATVTPNSGSTLPTGTVTFFDGSSLIGSVAVDPTGVAEAFTASLTPGSHSITATYGGTTAFTTSTSAALTEVVTNNVTTTTTLAASANPIAQGQLLAITATVAGGATTGTVTFNDGAAAIGTVAIDPTTGQAVGFWSTLGTGTHNITATYSGSPGFASSTSVVLNLVIGQNVSTTTTLAASLNPTVIGQLIALTANVSGNGGIPTGNVTFKDGTTAIGTVAIDPTTGQAVGFTSFLTTGTHNITAVYSGDTGYSASTSAAVAETVNLVGADTATTLAVSPSPGLVGQAVALIATVTSISGTPTGSVTFTDGSTLIGTVAINPTTHQAIGFTASLTAGAHSITATYNGSASFAGSVSSAVSELVNPVGILTTTTLTSSATGTVFDQLILMTATVASSGGTPTGNVTFLDGTTPIGTVALANNSGSQQAVGFIAGLQPGMHSITAVYAGANGFATSTSSVVHEVVNPDATVTSLIASGNNVTAGNLVALVAAVTAEAPGGGIPAGTVTFEDGSTLIGTVNVDPTSGDFIGYTNSLAPGAHSITAVYTPFAAYNASTSAPLSETIVGLPTTTIVTASAATVTMGQNVTFTATVTGSGNMPTGTVTFTSGSITLGTGTLDNTGKAVATEYNLNAGTYPVTATYNGDGTHATSVSSGAGSASFAVTTPTFTTVQVPSVSSSYQTATAQTGTGAAVQSGQVISAEYTLYLADGTLSQTNVGSAPFQVAVGEGNLVPGFDAGVIGIKVGEVRVLVLQPAAGYGADPPSGIPANEVLTFIVKLVGVDLPRLTVSEGPSGATPVAVTNGQAPSAATGTDFGTSTVGLSTAPSTFTFGDADASLGFILASTHNPIVQILGADPSDFVVTQPSLLVTQDQTDPAGEGGGTVTNAGTFTIAFLPTAKGVRTATIEISTNDPDVPTFTFTVQGIGM